MTAQELYDRDPGFRGFLAAWEDDRRCPLELVDYLLDRDMYTQAECARWMHEGIQWESWQGNGPNLTARMPWLLQHRGWKFSLSAGPGDDRGHRAHRLPYGSVGTAFFPNGEITRPSFAETVIVVFDAWLPQPAEVSA